MKKEKQQEQPKKLRQILIETDGNNIYLTKAEVAGNLELIAILQSIVARLQQGK